MGRRIDPERGTRDHRQPANRQLVRQLAGHPLAVGAARPRTDDGHRRARAALPGSGPGRTTPPADLRRALREQARPRTTARPRTGQSGSSRPISLAPDGAATAQIRLGPIDQHLLGDVLRSRRRRRQHRPRCPAIEHAAPGRHRPHLVDEQRQRRAGRLAHPHQTRQGHGRLGILGHNDSPHRNANAMARSARRRSIPATQIRSGQRQPQHPVIPATGQPAAPHRPVQQFGLPSLRSPRPPHRRARHLRRTPPRRAPPPRRAERSRASSTRSPTDRTDSPAPSGSVNVAGSSAARSTRMSTRSINGPDKPAQIPPPHPGRHSCNRRPSPPRTDTDSPR